MPTVKEYNARIARLRSTRKMTKTMKMVAANKLRRAQEALRHAELAGAHLQRLRGMAAAAGGTEGESAESHGRAPRALLLVITSDRGLCGGFNHGVHRAALDWIGRREAEGIGVDVSCFGRRGYLFLRHWATFRKQYSGDSARPRYMLVTRIARELADVFRTGRYRGVFVAYNRFRSALSQAPVVEALLPPDGVPAAAGDRAAVILAPNPADVEEGLRREAVTLKLFAAFLHSAVGEHGARMTAMDNSTANADRLIDSYTLLRNRARQAAITRELIEIVAGAEALA